MQNIRKCDSNLLLLLEVVEICSLSIGQWPLIKFKVVVLSCDIFIRADEQWHVYTICQISEQVFPLSKHWWQRSENKWREKVKPYEQRIFINAPWFIQFCDQSMSHWVAINANGVNERINCWGKTPTTIYCANLMSLYFNNSCIKPIWWSDGMNKRPVHYGRVNFTWDLVICNTLLQKHHTFFSDGPVHYWTLFHWLQLKKVLAAFIPFTHLLLALLSLVHMFTCYPYFRPSFPHLPRSDIDCRFSFSIYYDISNACACVCMMLGQYICVYSII